MFDEEPVPLGARKSSEGVSFPRSIPYSLPIQDNDSQTFKKPFGRRREVLTLNSVCLWMKYCEFSSYLESINHSVPALTWKAFVFHIH